MIFNSIEFAIFLPIVFTIYWYAFYGNVQKQNFALLVASLFFYAWWDWSRVFAKVLAERLAQEERTRAREE